MSIVLLTKDAFLRRYLPVYGNTYWKTPNIDELAAKGTVFDRYYTAAPSTVMAFIGMSAGKYPYELERKTYQVEDIYNGHTYFDTAIARGMSPHIIWSDNYMKDTLPFANCFKGTQIHTIDMNQPVGPHLTNVTELVADEEKARRTLNKLYSVIDEIPKDNVFLWIHLPHVLLGRTCYGGDIDLVDEIVGYLRKKYGDDDLYFSADHGNMDGFKGVYGYGFHVSEPAIRIPLIAPRLEGCEHIDFPVSNTQLEEIMFEKKVKKRDFVVSETTYYMQPNRRTAIIIGNYKYVYNKSTKKEELYDVCYDESESRNLVSRLIYDPDRNRYTEQRETYFYPYYDEAEQAYKKAREAFNTFWRQGTFWQEFNSKIKFILVKHFGKIIYRALHGKSKVRKD